ncbi:hypothetical protein B0H19DRAFT_317047 [Mycena capillaripes]|nr:hypothetical protein B0H19DRAFT_317047 [Mycena capillaripes]
MMVQIRWWRNTYLGVSSSRVGDGDGVLFPCHPLLLEVNVRRPSLSLGLMNQRRGIGKYVGYRSLGCGSGTSETLSRVHPAPAKWSGLRNILAAIRADKIHCNARSFSRGSFTEFHPNAGHPSSTAFSPKSPMATVSRLSLWNACTHHEYTNPRSPELRTPQFWLSRCVLVANPNCESPTRHSGLQALGRHVFPRATICVPIGAR